ncbi:non-homologous end joining protein Ku [Actinomadura rupiterrae]|uniref:non-homologous end joining protein Ku n=1 Tax=Actinomadura rupiterrae TaxID=559627 RepID=UPI0020A613CE|nr:Ku protein [Actinomadura rupiterrae]MCP2336482.1 DNA end-binding protein Ku [Actinomadura rupiterrae]
MRSIWKGAISFGLVTIPVKLYSATEQRDVSFHQVHREDGGRIRYKRVCTLDGEEVAYSDIAKGFELPSGEMVVLTDEDFADLPLSSSRRVDVLEFVDAEEVDPIYFNKSYFLEPDSQGVKPYVLLRDALEESGKVALVKVALRQRESLATLRVREGVFVLETMLWPDEVRTADFPFLDEDIDVRRQELTMATSLIDSMSGDFDPGQYKDTYREALESVIEAKVEGREVVQPAEEEGEAPAADLLSALRASVEAAKKGRGGSGTAKKSAPAKKSATSKKAATTKKRAASGGTSGEGGTRARGGTTRKTAAKKSTSAKTAKKSESPKPRSRRSA